MHLMKKSFEGTLNTREKNSVISNKNRVSTEQKMVKTTHKVILLGDADVGKTAIFTRLTQNKFHNNTANATVSMDIGRKVFCIKE